MIRFEGALIFKMVNLSNFFSLWVKRLFSYSMYLRCLYSFFYKPVKWKTIIQRNIFVIQKKGENTTASDNRCIKEHICCTKNEKNTTAFDNRRYHPPTFNLPKYLHWIHNLAPARLPIRISWFDFLRRSRSTTSCIKKEC